MRTRFHDLDPALFPLPAGLAEEVLSPALVVYLDHVRENLRRVIGLCGGAERWRPHVKTTKIPEVWAELARAGLRRFKCATTREAAVLLEVLEREGVEGDLLVAYPLVGPALARLGELAERFPRTRLSVLCEDADSVEDVPSGVSVFADVDPGMGRTGIPMEETGAILDVARRAGERFRGVHSYEGHLHDPDEGRRREEAFAGYGRLLELAAALAREGLRPEEIATSGTPAFLHALAYEPFRELEGTAHRVSPGTVVFHDLRSEQENAGLDLLPATVVFSRVVSRPGRDRVTCDAGSKAIAAEAGDPCAIALGAPGLAALSPSEEHLPFVVESGERPERGAPLLLVPRHVCPTVNLAEEAVLVEGGAVRAMVQVAARGHELRPV